MSSAQKGASTRGVRNNNPGNIRHNAGIQWEGTEGVPQTDREFVTFAKPEFGIRAIARVLITYQDKRRAKDGSRIDTIREFIDRWAPSTENNTDAYVRRVARLTNIGAQETISIKEWRVMRALVVAIIDHECAGYSYPDDVIDRGLLLAGLTPDDRGAVLVQPPPKPLQDGGVIGTIAGGAGAVILAAEQAAEHYEPIKQAIEPVAGELAGLVAFVLIAGFVMTMTWRVRRRRQQQQQANGQSRSREGG